MPPIKTRGELAKERGEPWPPVSDTPTPVGTVPSPVPGMSPTQTNGVTPHIGGNGQQPNGGSSPDGPPYYGAPPGWTPATTPSGQSWSPPWDRPSGVQDAVPGQSGASDDDQPRRQVDTEDRDTNR
jgi:cell division protease FtsH